MFKALFFLIFLLLMKTSKTLCLKNYMGLKCQTRKHNFALVMNVMNFMPFE